MPSKAMERLDAQQKSETAAFKKQYSDKKEAMDAKKAETRAKQASISPVPSPEKKMSPGKSPSLAGNEKFVTPNGSPAKSPSPGKERIAQQEATEKAEAAKSKAALAKKKEDREAKKTQAKSAPLEGIGKPPVPPRSPEERKASREARLAADKEAFQAEGKKKNEKSKEVKAKAERRASVEPRPISPMPEPKRSPSKGTPEKPLTADATLRSPSSATTGSLSPARGDEQFEAKVQEARQEILVGKKDSMDRITKAKENRALRAKAQVEKDRAEMNNNNPRDKVKKLAEKGAKRAESRGKLREQYDTITSPSPVTSPGAMGDVALVANQACELLDVVHQLILPPPDGGCPWVEQQNPESLLSWLRSEVEEVTEQLVEVQKTGDPGAKERLEIELGDLAFDTLLLISLCRRDFPSARAESPYKMAADKVRRRVPYIWGKNGEKADSAEEAEAHWQRVKAEEKSEALARGNLISGTESSGGGWLTWTAAVLLAVGGAGVAAAKFKMLKV